MRDSIVINISNLRSLVKDMKRLGMDYVNISISDSDGEGDDFLPACLDFTCCKNSDLDTWVDFEPIDAVDNETELIDKSLNGLHMSDTML